ncbi:MAG TPA: Tab2/Atab2 family RNA-binding protein [Oscillatoriaceae cyanobacterium M33_DOE_052]|uniref:DUF1092 family protein n=1 Tax=Planktothricoides sp. SpSt-374 TaxID=2282167 RepID=A0A7C3VSY9_9CYAN|nr:Tab2/Atab2 family RNA-binding protein [Oscillatoriaceae cyanobacterium M33_DOE_052]
MRTTWELDFYSRPMVDDAGKKVWEVLICESPTGIYGSEKPFRFQKFCPNTEVNSVWLGNAIEEATQIAGVAPKKIRFFRRQMNNMISKACQDKGIDAVPSRRTGQLQRWLQERMELVYPNQPGFKAEGVMTSVRFETPPPSPLPDALRGDKWAFVTLAAADFQDMDQWQIDFGEAFPIFSATTTEPGKEGSNYVVAAPELTPESRIPGAIVFSSRALALAGWMSGLDLAFLRVEFGSGVSGVGKLILETGASQSWILASFRDEKTRQEAKRFAEAKEKSQQIHFLAVQSDPDAESFAGFWLLQEVNLP